MLKLLLPSALMISSVLTWKVRCVSRKNYSLDTAQSYFLYPKDSCKINRLCITRINGRTWENVYTSRTETEKTHTLEAVSRAFQILLMTPLGFITRIQQLAGGEERLCAYLREGRGKKRSGEKIGSHQQESELIRTSRQVPRIARSRKRRVKNATKNPCIGAVWHREKKHDAARILALERKTQESTPGTKSQLRAEHVPLFPPPYTHAHTHTPRGRLRLRAFFPTEKKGRPINK